MGLFDGVTILTLLGWVVCSKITGKRFTLGTPTDRPDDLDWHHRQQMMMHHHHHHDHPDSGADPWGPD